jgi:hypothetical protein
MGLRERLEEKATLLGESARKAANSAPAQRLGESFRGLRKMFDGDAEQSLSIDQFLLSLVRAVRVDGQAEERSKRDVYVTARKRRRRLGLISFGAGPLVGVANQVADLYCETAVVCDIAALHGLEMSDEQVAAHMLVLWEVTDDLDVAQRALRGAPPIADLVGVKLMERADEHLPERFTKRSVAKALWDLRGSVGDARKEATSGAVRTVAFAGHRTKKLIKQTEIQLGLRA